MKKFWISLSFLASLQASAGLKLPPFEAEKRPSQAAQHWGAMTSYMAPLSIGIRPTHEMAATLRLALVLIGQSAKNREWFTSLLPACHHLACFQSTDFFHPSLFERLAQVSQNPAVQKWFNRKVGEQVPHSRNWATHLKTLHQLAELSLTPNLGVIDSLTPLLGSTILHQVLMTETGIPTLPYPWLVSLYVSFPPETPEDLQGIGARTGRPWNWWEPRVPSASHGLTDCGSPAHRAWVQEMQQTYRPGWYRLATLVRIPADLRNAVTGFLRRDGLRALLEGCFSADQIRDHYEEWAANPERRYFPAGSPTPRRRFGDTTKPTEALPVWVPKEKRQ